MKNLSFNYIIDVVFNEEPTRLELFWVACCLAVFWGIILESGRKIIAGLVYDKPWLHSAMVREYHREGKKMCEQFGSEMSQEEYVDSRKKDWGWMQLILVQHFIGGILCVPSVLNLLGESTASSLACLSILSEMGWEIQDLLVMYYRRFFLPDGKKLVPDVLLVIMPMHHSLTTLLGIPTILRYRKLKIFHWLCFDLQVATAISLGIGEYTKLLDVTQDDELFRFTVLTLVGFLVCVWARVIHWFYLVYRFALVWIDEGAWNFLFVGSVVALLFSCFSWFVCVQPFYKRLGKFLKMSAKYQSLPQDAPSRQRRSSMIALQDAAKDLSDVVHMETFSAEVAALFENRKQPSRRESMPASVLERQRRLSGYSRGGKGGIPRKAVSDGMTSSSLLTDPAFRKALQSSMVKEE